MNRPIMDEEDIEMAAVSRAYDAMKVVVENDRRGVQEELTRLYARCTRLEGALRGILTALDAPEVVDLDESVDAAREVLGIGGAL